MEDSFETILLQGWRGEYGEVLEGILVSVFLKKWNLFLLVGDEILFFFFYRFIGDLDWDSGYSPFSSLLFLYRIFLVIYFIFRISTALKWNLRDCIVDFLFFVSLRLYWKS